MRWLAAALALLLVVSLTGVKETSWPDIGIPGWPLFLATGSDPHYDSINKFGFSPMIDQNMPFEEVWEGTGPYLGFNATDAEIIEVFSSSALDTAAGTGARILGLRGLDADFNEVVELIPLMGVTPQNSVNEYIRVFRARIMTAGSGGENVGQVTVRQSVTTANVFAQMLPGFNQTSNATYTVPAGKVGFLTNLMCSMDAQSSGAENNSVCRLAWRAPGSTFQVKDQFAIISLGASGGSRFYPIPKGPIAPRSDIAMLAMSNRSGTRIYASMDIVLIDERRTVLTQSR